MNYRRLGRTALQVSELCLGTMNFGPETPEAESHAIMDRALDLGINFFDTANRYGGSKGAGATEEIIGRWFALGGGRREKVVLATKLYGRMSEWPNDGRPVGTPHPRRVRREPAPPADRPHRPLPDASRRPECAVGRDLAGDGHARAAGQDHLRRQQQLRRLAHRAGQRASQGARLSRPGQRAEPLQPVGPHGRARSAAGVPRLRRWCDPVEPAVERAARRRAEHRSRPRAAARRISRADREAPTAAREVGGVCAPSWAKNPPRSRWPGCCIRTA